MKNMIISRVILTCAAALFFMLMRCADLTGGASEAGNARVIGMIVDDQGLPVGSAIVQIIPSAYDPVKDGPIGDTSIDTTAGDGIYRFKVPKGSTYTIQAVHRVLRTRASAYGVETFRNDDITVPPCTLKVPGVIKAALPAGADLLSGYLYVPGTTVAALLGGAAGFVFLDSVPAGIVPVVSYSTINGAISRVIRYAVRLSPGDTAVIFNPAWHYARQMLLNTSAAGANVSGNVYDFPVLVRLTAGTFTFTQAKADGADIRFTKADNTPLLYEIERWDSANAQAEIWVKVDTVYGNDSMHCLTMYWGNPDAIDSSNAGAVFDTSHGFQGVWHLDENGNSTAGGYADATANACNGTGSAGMRQYTNVDGIIGKAQRFNGDNTRISGPAPAKISGNASFTVMFWMNFSPAPVRSWVLYFGDYQAELQMCHFLIHPDDTAQFGLSGGPAVQDTLAQNIFDLSSFRGIWSLATTVYDASNSTLTTFINSIQMDKRTVLDANIIPAGGMHISQKPANHAIETGYYGLLDELRICSKALSADWIRLSYMNQKAMDALITDR